MGWGGGLGARAPSLASAPLHSATLGCQPQWCVGSHFNPDTPLDLSPRFPLPGAPACRAPHRPRPRPRPIQREPACVPAGTGANRDRSIWGLVGFFGVCLPTQRGAPQGQEALALCNLSSPCSGGQRLRTEELNKYLSNECVGIYVWRQTGRPCMRVVVAQGPGANLSTTAEQVESLPTGHVTPLSPVLAEGPRSRRKGMGTSSPLGTGW